ncbi:hypothetical protein F5Y17DRAFT_457505 [Xylariaceae sp. FL0594]|nr:hypothetical protein F5Y17DRAFT_457505 [Xylariaceae sp. FL0594]
MSDYDSGDELFGDADADELLRSGNKHARSPSTNDHVHQPAKRGRVDAIESAAPGGPDRYDAIAESALKKYFGYDSFRHEQAAAISTTLRGNNALVIFPTGAGKSLCYHIPGIVFPELDAAGLTDRQPGSDAGITIVVSPLIALMKDQVDALIRRGIAAACLDSTKSHEQQIMTNEAMQAGKLRILYCAPERLNNEGFVEIIKHLPGGIRLVAVDEAHCISEWGHSFRPDKFSAAAFHVGLPTETKTETQDAFMAGEIRIVVATIAFGMGIDKSGIRNILHYDVPSTIEEYSQQIGRAGRDGKDSSWRTSSVATYLLGNRYSLYWWTSSSNNPVENLPEGGNVIKLNQIALGREHDVRPTTISIILATIELRYGLIRAITPGYSAYQFEARPSYFSKAKSDTSPAAEAITANSAGLLPSDIISKLNEFDNKGHILLKASGVVNRFKILKQLPKTKKKIGELTDKLYAEMEAREADAMRRFEAMCDMVTHKKCFARALAEYFGTGLPDKKPQCRHCTYCLTKEPVVLPPKKNPPVDHAGIKAILDFCDVRDDPRFLARIAFGIKSPRVTRLKLDRNKLLGSLEDHDFTSLMDEFTKACVECGFDPNEKFS